MTTATQGEPSATLEEPSSAFFAFCFAPPGTIIKDHQCGGVQVSHVATHNSGSLYLVEAHSVAELEAAVLALHLTFAPEHLDAAHTLAIKI